jgi:hypothetical protein
MILKGTVGAPTKFTPEVRKIIIEARRKGMPWEHAGALAGICENTLTKWRELGESDKPENADYCRFLQDLKMARAEWVQDQLDIIGKAASGGAWQASAWKLERVEADTFSLKNRHEVTGGAGEPIELVISHVFDKPDNDEAE